MDVTCFVEVVRRNTPASVWGGAQVYWNRYTTVQNSSCTEPEIIDPVFAKTSQNGRFLLSENERFGLVFVKTGSINSGTVLLTFQIRLL
jgi:hypothetical protein